MVEETGNSAVTPASPSARPPGEDRRAAATSRFTVRANDPNEVEAALVDAASAARNIWVLFLSFGTYLIVTVRFRHPSAARPRRPDTLAAASVDLPMVAFFVVARVLFLIFHNYLLLHLKLMADKVRRYSDLLTKLVSQKSLKIASACNCPISTSCRFLLAHTKDGTTLANGCLGSEPKCNTPADLIVGTVDHDLRECCHAVLFAFVG